jgi:tetratricopeptide (TPR) repeat protein
MENRISLTKEAKAESDEGSNVARYRRIAGLLEEMGGASDPATHTGVALLADALEKNGELQEAEQTFQSLLEEMERAPGFDHPHTLIVAMKLAILYRNARKFDVSESLFRRVLDSLEKSSEPDYSFIFTVLSAWGKMLDDAGRLNEAEAVLIRAVEGRIHLHGPTHESTRRSAERLDSVREKMRNITTTDTISILGSEQIRQLQT